MLYVSECHSCFFKWLNNTALYDAPHFVFCSSVDGHSDCFYLLDITVLQHEHCTSILSLLFSSFLCAYLVKLLGRRFFFLSISLGQNLDGSEQTSQ